RPPRQRRLGGHEQPGLAPELFCRLKLRSPSRHLDDGGVQTFEPSSRLDDDSSSLRVDANPLAQREPWSPSQSLLDEHRVTTVQTNARERGGNEITRVFMQRIQYFADSLHGLG